MSIAPMSGIAASAKRAGSATRAIAPLLRIDPAFDRRRRRGQHHREAADAGAHHRHVAGVVEDAVLLLVGGVVLLVDDDQAELRERQEQRRARAGHHPHAAFGDLPPDPLAHAAAAGRSAIRPAWRRSGPGSVRGRPAVSAISGSRISTCLPAVERRRDRFEIDLGLARAGDAVEQRDAEMPARRRCAAQRIGRRALVGG